MEIESIPLKDWPLHELRRRHTLALVDHMLRVEGRATTGAVGILRALSAMAEDAIIDEVCDLNPFKGIRIRANDPRRRRSPARSASSASRRCTASPRQRTATRRWSASSPTPACDSARSCRCAGKTSTARRSKSAAPPTRAEFSKEPRPTTESPTPAASSQFRRPFWMLEAQINVNGDDSNLLFTTPRGRLWRERTFYRDLWKPAQEASGLDIRPHECRHNYITHLRAAGVNDADLAEIAGHRVETMLAHYTLATGASFDAIRNIVD